MSKERFQNPVCGDTVNLRLFTYNSNNKRDIQSIEKVEIYIYDKTEISDTNPSGLRLVKTIDGEDVVREDTGTYLLEVDIESPLFTIGDYQDVWYVNFEDTECATATVANDFVVYPDLWFTTTSPPFYDFSFRFSPNKIRKGSKRYIVINVIPNVPKGNIITKYYENLAIVSDLKVSIEMSCGKCLPQEKDLRLIVDKETVLYKENGQALYFIDTEDMEEGIYNIWFELTFGENTFISEKDSFQIFE